jgi:hypothetical protein
MTAASIERQSPDPEHNPSPRPTLVPPAADNAHKAELRAEQTVFRDAGIGAVIGVVLCVPVWVGMVWLALRNSDQPLLPPIAMAAGIGVLAGVFVGGWAGTLVGATKLEKFEREHRPKHDSAGQ